MIKYHPTSWLAFDDDVTRGDFLKTKHQTLKTVFEPTISVREFFDSGSTEYILMVIPDSFFGEFAMSKLLSLKLQDEVFKEAEEILRLNRKRRNSYFNEAINLYNKLWKRKLLKKSLTEESRLIADESLSILEAFELLEDELD
ncbi:MAG TPA: hypothetical protein VNN20_06725 [Thermodesulfobacteriota bacterium]|nr:hypothetical protein [Thermodesulfobacteriota bacterium]